ncbi:MAG: DUF2849 domain-containing protein [Parvularculaceae bacterium]|nr:DUF2849 domain-containing protein [Parvularculaceae bacterium]
MKAVTANRLADGAVVWLGPGGALVDRFDAAILLEGAAADAALAAVAAQTTIVASAYLIDADASGPTGREALRETIRRNGPTVRRDLGKQAEAGDERL